MWTTQSRRRGHDQLRVACCRFFPDGFVVPPPCVPQVGMFDTSNPANPYAGPYNESELDGATHRALAREAVAKSTVLLENRGGALPLLSLPARIGVIGPFR